MGQPRSIDDAMAVFDKAQSQLRPLLAKGDPMVSYSMESCIGFSYLARAINEIQDKLADIELKLARRP